MNGRPDMDEGLLDEAIAWHAAMARDDADWDAYLAWLEADPRHAHAFDEVALVDRMVTDHAPALRSAYEPAPSERRWRRPAWIGGIAAAAVAIAVVTGVPLLREPAPDRVYATASSGTEVRLPGGVVAALGAETRLVAVGGRADDLRLERGEAFFDVRHDPSRALSLTAGGYTVTDVGTRFSINLAPSWVTVAVADGQLAVASPRAGRVGLVAGQRLLAARGGGGGRVSPVAPVEVGGWRRGRLVYHAAPLEVVAADLARYTGRRVVVDSAIGARPFSGVLIVDDGAKSFRNLAELMGLTYAEDGNAVRLGAVRGR